MSRRFNSCDICHRLFNRLLLVRFSGLLICKRCREENGIII